MNELQKLIQSRAEYWYFLDDESLKRLIELDRLFQVLVRCGGCRFTCGAQYVDHMITCIEAGGDYVRDVSFPVGSMERASVFTPPGLARAPRAPVPATTTPSPKQAQRTITDFDPAECGGVWDGFQVTSDADPGL